MNVDHEVMLLQQQMVKLGKKQPDGSYVVKYGVLFRETAQIFEALLGTLRAAKKRYRSLPFERVCLLCVCDLIGSDVR
jgi:hypothetical protein